MNYHNIQKEDMLNGSGIRVVLFVSGCTHNCENCHNPQTHSFESGIKFDSNAFDEIVEELKKDYVSGLTLSGGDPLNENNVPEILNLCVRLKEMFPEKDIWCYTGYTWEELRIRCVNESLLDILMDFYINVVVDGKFIEELKDVSYPYAGSTNQRVIDVEKSIVNNHIVLWNNK